VGFLFTEVVKLNLEEHLPKQSSLKKEPFNRWLELFSKTIDAHFSGPKAHLTKKRAMSIATVIQLKIAPV
jgi:hemoglobin